MHYDGKRLQLAEDAGVAVLTFNNTEGSVNKFDRATLGELRTVADLLTTETSSRSDSDQRKTRLHCRADITEFGELFQGTEEQLIEWSSECNL